MSKNKNKNKKRKKSSQSTHPVSRNDTRAEAIQKHSAAVRRIAQNMKDSANNDAGGASDGLATDGVVLEYAAGEDGTTNAREVRDEITSVEDVLKSEDSIPEEVSVDGKVSDSDTDGYDASGKEDGTNEIPDDEGDLEHAMIGEGDNGSGLSGEEKSSSNLSGESSSDISGEVNSDGAISAGEDSLTDNPGATDSDAPAIADHSQKDAANLPPEAAASAESAKRFRLKPWRLLTKTARIVAIVVVCLIVAGFGFFHYEYSRLQKVDPDAYTDENVKETVAKDATDKELKKSTTSMEKLTENLEETEAVKAEGEIFSDSDVYNILLIGTDDRTKKFSAEARGDSCLLLSLNKTTGKVNLLSFERGMGVPILWGPYQGEWDWLTHTFRYGGAEMMVEEIRDNFKVDVSKYIRINIRTLVKIIDAMGGIDIELTQAEANHLNHPEGTYTEGYAKGVGLEDELQHDLTEGLNHLNGTTAMVLARTRAIDDDWHRVERQRRVIIAAQKKLNSLNAVQLAATLDAIVPLINTNLTETEVADLITLAPDFLGADVNQQTIPAEGTYGSMRGMDNRPCFAVDFAANAKLIRTLLYGEEAAAEIGATTDDEEANSARENYSQSKGETSTTYGSSSQSSSGSGYSSTYGNSSGNTAGGYTGSQRGQNQTTGASQNLPDVVSQTQDDTQTETGIAADGTVMIPDGSDAGGTLTDGTGITGTDQTAGSQTQAGTDTTATEEANAEAPSGQVPAQSIVPDSNAADAAQQNTTDGAATDGAGISTDAAAAAAAQQAALAAQQAAATGEEGTSAEQATGQTDESMGGAMGQGGYAYEQ